MELVIKENIDVAMGETVYYVNTGKSKSQADVKKVTHYYKDDGLFGDKKDFKVALEKEWKQDTVDGRLAEASKKLSLTEWVKKHHPEVKIEEEIILNCKLVPRNIIDSENDYLCEEGEEYNVAKYISMFNSRITPLLVCFHPDIRNKILITNPEDKSYFTYEECELCSGFPNKESDQDTYEQLMTMDDKEIRFWKNHPQWKIPFLKECNMDWDKIVADYDERMKREKELGIERIREKVELFLANMTPDMIEDLEDGVLSPELLKIVDVDPKTGNLVSKEYPDIVIVHIYDLYDKLEEAIDEEQAEEEQ